MDLPTTFCKARRLRRTTVKTPDHIEPQQEQGMPAQNFRVDERELRSRLLLVKKARDAPKMLKNPEVQAKLHANMIDLNEWVTEQFR